MQIGLFLFVYPRSARDVSRYFYCMPLFPYSLR